MSDEMTDTDFQTARCRCRWAFRSVTVLGSEKVGKLAEGQDSAVYNQGQLSVMDLDRRTFNVNFDNNQLYFLIQQPQAHSRHVLSCVSTSRRQARQAIP